MVRRCKISLLALQIVKGDAPYTIYPAIAIQQTQYFHTNLTPKFPQK